MRLLLESAVLLSVFRLVLRIRLVSAAEMREFGVFCACLVALFLLSRLSESLVSRLSAVPPRFTSHEE